MIRQRWGKGWVVWVPNTDPKTGDPRPGRVYQSSSLGWFTEAPAGIGGALVYRTKREALTWARSDRATAEPFRGLLTGQGDVWNVAHNQDEPWPVDLRGPTERTPPWT